MFTMRVEGGAELAATLRQLSTRLSDRILRDALLEIGEPMRASVARGAPRDPGAPDLADNINLGPVRKTAGDLSGDVKVGIGSGRGFFYDWFLEYGTVKMRARPFYRPAFDTEAPRGLGKLGEILWRELAGRGLRQAAREATTPIRSQGRGL